MIEWITDILSNEKVIGALLALAAVAGRVIYKMLVVKYKGIDDLIKWFRDEIMKPGTSETEKIQGKLLAKVALLEPHKIDPDKFRDTIARVNRLKNG